VQGYHHFAAERVAQQDMQIQREDLNPCTVKLEITCEPDEVKEGFERAFKKAAKQVRIPGFRPGHAPRALVEQQLSKEMLKEEAAENIIRTSYKKAVEQLDLKPYSTGAVELKSLDEDEFKCEFTAKVPLAPQVEIGDYESIPVERPAAEVTDAEIDQQIEDMRRRHSTREAVSDRGVEEGDVAVANIKIDGEEGDGRNFMIVAGKTFPQLDEALSGMKVEDLKHLELTFPDSFQEKDWAGKAFSCQLTLRSLSSVKLPELEEVAKTYQLETPEELKERVRDAMIVSRQQAVDDYVNEQLIETLMQRSNVCVPDTMWEAVANQKLADVAQNLREQEKSIEDFVKESGMSEEEFIEAQRKEAKTFVMRAQLIQDLFIKENMQVSNVELNRELDMMARENRMEPKELLEALKKNGALREIQYQAIHRKVMDFLNTKAESKEVAKV
jgi:trigger factor